jgi:D-alanyl-D-alanine carboxypeptidase (penicillin-binding protein 5/6)
MNLIIKIIIFFLISFKIFAVDTTADQAIVIDFDTSEVLFEKNADQVVPPASMTKIMTTYAAFDRLKNTGLSINGLCKISPKAYKMGGSRTFLELDDSVSIEDLLKGIIIQSGNDASVALAECLAGTEEDFSRLMNSYASKLGMSKTNFINSSGWPAKDHYSTVRDIAILSNALIKNFPNFYEYFNLSEFSYNSINQPNRNKLLSNVLGADGLKTGFTQKSGWGIAGSAIQNNRRITVVINGANSSRLRLNESSYLLNWAFTQTAKKRLLNKNQIVKNVDVWLGNKPTVNLIVGKNIDSILSFDQLQLIQSTISYEKPISPPIKKGDTLGLLEIKISGKKTLKIPLIAEKNVYKINPIFKVFAAIKYLIFGTSLDEF